MTIKAESFFGTDPEPVICIFANTGNAVIDQRSRIAYFIPENFKVIAIIPVQPVVSTEPHKPLPVLVYTGNRVVGNALFNTQVIYRRVLLCNQPGTRYQQANAA
jgi:hypothetical protein